MLSFVKLCNQNKKFSRLTGVKLEEFLEIVKQVLPLLEKFQNSKKVSGHIKLITRTDSRKDIRRRMPVKDFHRPIINHVLNSTNFII